MNGESKPGYYAVIPANVRYDKRLSFGARFLYGEITALCNSTGTCWATNKYFAELYEKDERTIRRYIEQLAELGYITVTIHFKDDTKQADYRCIQLVAPPDKNVRTPGQKCPLPPDKNVRKNNTSMNTTLNNQYKTNKKNFNKNELLTPPSYDLEQFKAEAARPIIYERKGAG